MGNPRQRRKQRSGAGAVTRRTANRHAKKISINNELIKGEWDVTATLKQNYETLGLAHDLDKAVNNPAPAKQSSLIRKLEAFAAAEIRTEHNLSDNQIETLRKLIAKHGEDYAAMARDIKVNKYQLTEGQLRRQVARLSGLDGAGAAASEATNDTVSA